MRAALLVLASCAPSAPPPPVVTPVAHVATPAPAPTPPPKPPEPPRPPETCADIEACLAQNDATFPSQHDLAITAAYSMCEHAVPEACLQTASFLEQIHVAARFDTTPKDLRARAITQLDEQCTAGQGAACLRQGKLLLFGKYIAADPKRAAELAERGCTLGDGTSCLFAADLYSEGHKVTRDKKRALGLWDRACEANAAAGCTRLAERIAKTERARAATLYARGCTGNDALGCARTAELELAAKDRDHALAHYTTACELEHTPSCHEAGKLVEPSDPAKARELYDKGCHDDVGPACARLGGLYAKALGGARDWGKAVELYDKACKLAAPGSCAEGKTVRAHPPDWHCATAEACTALCNEHVGPSCTALVRIQAQGGDCSSVGLLADACGWGDPAACVLAGNAGSEPSRVIEWYQRACAAHAPEGCTRYAYARATLGAPEDRAGAIRSLEVACHHETLACTLLGDLVEHDKPARAQQLWRAACDKHDGLACALLAGPNYGHGYGTCCESQAEIDEEAREAAREEAARKSREALVRRACDFGDLHSCEEIGDTQRAAQLADPCGLAGAATR